MANGVRYLKTKTFVKLAALEMFLEAFECDAMIHGLIELCEFAVTHPYFGEAGYPGGMEYLAADEATDALITFFEEQFCCDADATGAPQVIVNYKTGAIELLKHRYRPRRTKAPSLKMTTAEVKVRLANRLGSEN